MWKEKPLKMNTLQSGSLPYIGAPPIILESQKGLLESGRKIICLQYTWCGTQAWFPLHAETEGRNCQQKEEKKQETEESAEYRVARWARINSTLASLICLRKDYCPEFCLIIEVTVFCSEVYNGSLLGRHWTLFVEVREILGVFGSVQDVKALIKER